MVFGMTPISLTDRICPPPPDPPTTNDGIPGTSSFSRFLGTGYNPPIGFVVVYTCGEGRMFHNVIDARDPYTEAHVTCMDDLTWKPEHVRKNSVQSNL